METTVVYWRYIGIYRENGKMETTIVYGDTALWKLLQWTLSPKGLGFRA